MLFSPFAGQTLEGDFVVAEWTAEPCPADGPMWIAPLHLHKGCDESWYVLEGRLAFLVNGQEYLAEAGSMVWVPKGATHTYWNPDPKTARYLILMTPKTHALIEAIHATDDRSMEGMKALFQRYDAEFIGF
jgi:mannose-6-phosphate isomerase-like protein (cupin superfamily)